MKPTNTILTGIKSKALQAIQNVKLINIILAILTGSITIAATVGVIAGKTHHIATAFMAAFITLLLIDDAKKATK